MRAICCYGYAVRVAGLDFAGMMMKRILLIAAAALALTACEQQKAKLSAAPTISEMHQLLERGDATSEQLVTELIRRAKESENLNAFITLDEVGALARAKELDASRASGNIEGALHGIPLVVKDNIHVAGLRNTGGTPGLADFVPDSDNAVIARLRDEGAIILGKTNMHELAFGITSDNAAFGSVRNPYDVSLIPGGSSGGTGAAVSAGLAPAGLGTDTGGSVRIPASLTGIAGYRPSTERYSSHGVTPISLTRDTIGFMARTVQDIQLLDSVVSGANKEVAPDKIRLGVPRRYFFSGLDSQTAAVTDTTLEKLAQAGIELIDVEVPQLGDFMAKTGFPIALYEARRDLIAYLDAFDTGLNIEELATQTASPDVTGVFGAVTDPATIPQEVYEAALLAREELRETYSVLFAEQNLHALIFPTTPLPARPIEGSIETVELNGEQVPTFPTYIRNTDPASIAALPGISLPVGLTNDGLPVGIELDGPEQSDARLLAIAEVIEEIVAFDAVARRH
jgi:Asp-tRNA(Asn)/Glu-tRNA(Gln) amidotransferase A subunit family amidase